MLPWCPFLLSVLSQGNIIGIIIAGKSFRHLNTKKQLLKAGFQNKNIGVNCHEIAKDTSLTQRGLQAKFHLPLEMPIWSELYFGF